MPEFKHNVPALNVVEEVNQYWCFAAVEQVLRKVFGKPDIAQTEIAHNSAIRLAGMANAGATTHWRNSVLYAQTAVAQLSNTGLADIQANWADLRPTLAHIVDFGQLDLGQGRLRELLQRIYGEIDLAQFTAVPLDPDFDVYTIVSAINDRKLVLAGTSNHWYLLYGYDYNAADQGTDETRKYRYLVYNVHGPEAMTRGVAWLQNPEMIKDILVVWAD